MLVNINLLVELWDNFFLFQQSHELQTWATNFDWSKVSSNQNPPNSNADQPNPEYSKNIESDLTSQQILALLVNSHVQQQTQFQQIMKNSLSVLEVMTTNMQNMNLLVASQLSKQQEMSALKDFLSKQEKTADAVFDQNENEKPPEEVSPKRELWHD